ncbi:hypothetical protein QTP88_003204 [Uroleucon formosanum]
MQSEILSTFYGYIIGPTYNIFQFSNYFFSIGANWYNKQGILRKSICVPSLPTIFVGSPNGLEECWRLIPVDRAAHPSSQKYIRLRRHPAAAAARQPLFSRKSRRRIIQGKPTPKSIL